MLYFASAASQLLAAMYAAISARSLGDVRRQTHLCLYRLLGFGPNPIGIGKLIIYCFFFLCFLVGFFERGTTCMLRQSLLSRTTNCALLRSNRSPENHLTTVCQWGLRDLCGLRAFHPLGTLARKWGIYVTYTACQSLG